MNGYIRKLFERYRRVGILLDSNILLLYFVGSFGKEEIERFKRTREKFYMEDYATLERILGYFEKVVTTPNILTEVSNLLGQLGEPSRANCFEVFARGITLLDERWLPSADISKMGEFKRFGLTDAGVVHLAREYLVVTEDFPLSQYLGKKGVDVLNFNHIRVVGWER